MLRNHEPKRPTSQKAVNNQQTMSNNQPPGPQPRCQQTTKSTSKPMINKYELRIPALRNARSDAKIRRPLAVSFRQRHDFDRNPFWTLQKSPPTAVCVPPGPTVNGRPRTATGYQTRFLASNFRRQASKYLFDRSLSSTLPSSKRLLRLGSLFLRVLIDF